MSVMLQLWFFSKVNRDSPHLETVQNARSVLLRFFFHILGDRDMQSICFSLPFFMGGFPARLSIFPCLSAFLVSCEERTPLDPTIRLLAGIFQLRRSSCRPRLCSWAPT
jgi:hypothetical protein